MEPHRAGPLKASQGGSLAAGTSPTHPLSPLQPFIPALSLSDLGDEVRGVATAYYRALRNKFSERLDQFGPTENLDPQIFETVEYKAALLSARYEVIPELPHAREAIRERLRTMMTTLTDRDLFRFQFHGEAAYQCARELGEIRASGFGLTFQEDAEYFLGRGLALHVTRNGASLALSYLNAFKLMGPISSDVLAASPQYFVGRLAADSVETFADLRVWLELKLAMAGRGEIVFAKDGATVTSTGFEPDMEPQLPGSHPPTRDLDLGRELDR